MAFIDLSPELKFQTTRSGGKGGQHVNKVETAVIASFHIDSSSLLSDEQKSFLKEKLGSRLNKEGYLLIKSQTHRSQSANKEEAIAKLNKLVFHALQKKKPRITTQASKASKEKRLEWKKRNAEIKSGRKKIKFDSY